MTASDSPFSGGTLVVAAVLLLVGAAVGGSFVALTDSTAPRADPAPDGNDGPGGDTDGTGATGATGNVSGGPEVVAFRSAEAFRAYLARASATGAPVRNVAAEPEARRTVEETEVARADGGDGGDDAATSGTAAPTATPTPVATSTPTAAEADAGDGGDGGGGGVDRASGTNVQVAGVDEPDVVKTLGGTTAYSLGRGRAAGGGPDTVLLNTSDPAAPAVASRVEASGRLLFANGGDTMLVLTGERLVAYDVTDRTDPERAWERSLNGRVAAARLAGGTVYLVVAERIDADEPCPVEPMDGATVDCDRVYHPREPVPVDTTYTTLAVRPADGNVTDAVSFVGSAATAATYVSRSSIYVTYRNRTDEGEAYLDYLLADGEAGFRDELPDGVVERLRTIRSYDLGPRARLYEARRTVEGWLRGLDDRRRDRLRDELYDGFRDYREAHKRELVRTGIVRVDYGDRDGDGDRDGLAVAETGSVPGVPLNQFSMSESDGRLRIATTVSAPGTESENDLYVLDDGLDVMGKVTGMGLTERVYSVRFVGETAYVVTFRRVDPFHVLNLSDPTDPVLEGELKLPGYSSYLHPLPGDRVLGIGEEDGRVKAVVFDVSTPSNPTIQEDRILDARWSAIAESHHAFLMDRKHGVFFLPTGEAGYVYSYEDGLSLAAEVDVDRAQRAIYLNDYLYVFGSDEVVVVDETDWERETTVRLRE